MCGLALALVLALVPPSAAAADLPDGYSPQLLLSPQAAANERYGESVAAGDVTGDGRLDLVIGVPAAQFSNAPGITGRVYAVNGVTGDVAWEAHQPTPQQEQRGSVDTGFGTVVEILGDIGECNWSSSSCQSLNPPDGAAEILVSAPGGDMGGAAGQDQGIVYVLDGKTGRTIKRIALSAPDRSLGLPGFGRSVLVPAGEPPCEGNGGIGLCPDTPRQVAMGDIDGGGRPDIVIGAPDFTETPETNELGCPGGESCPGIGRVFVFWGEDIAGSSNADLLSCLDDCPTRPRPTQSISYFEPADLSDPPHFGAALSPLGDIGKCIAPTTIGARCYGQPDMTSSEPDGVPDFLVGASGIDAGSVDVGSAFLIDGSVGNVVAEVANPAARATLVYPGSAMPLGDLGGSTLPDVALGTPSYDGSADGQGAAWAFDGDVLLPGGLPPIGRLDHPDPVALGAFGATVSAVGDVAGDAQTELAVAAGGSGAVHIFSACKNASLQRIEAPSAQAGSGFGSSILPVGDVNNDGYLDLAVTAPRFDGISTEDQGAVYVYISNASPGPVFAGCNPSTGGGGGTGGGTAAGGSGSSTGSGTGAGTDTPTIIRRTRRTITLVVKPRIVKAGKSVRLSGVIRTRSPRRLCRSRQKVAVQRQTAGTQFFQTFDVATSAADGKFSLRTTPDKTYMYRLRLQQNKRCEFAVSRTSRVVVAGGR